MTDLCDRCSHPERNHQPNDAGSGWFCRKKGCLCDDYWAPPLTDSEVRDLGFEPTPGGWRPIEPEGETTWMGVL